MEMKKMEKENASRELWLKVTCNIDLVNLEKAGFIHGVEKGKVMDTNIETIYESLVKQMTDLDKVFIKMLFLEGQPTISPEEIYEIKQCIADIRNVAGCLFLKVAEFEKNGLESLDQIEG